MKKLFLKAPFLIVILVLCSCAVKVITVPYKHEYATVSDAVQAERDEIYMLLAYSIVLNDWQNEEEVKKRGHNIGAILVDPNGQIVNWARNCNAALSNGTQHGEVRLMLSYLNRERGYSLKNHTIYTTLEPCAQCSGMMTLTNVYRTVYGQTDLAFGKAIERLTLNSRQWNKKGYEPYPRKVLSEKSKSVICIMLDDEYAKVGGSITRYLLTDGAKEKYLIARNMLDTYQVKYTNENQKLLMHAQETLLLVKPGIPEINIAK